MLGKGRAVSLVLGAASVMAVLGFALWPGPPDNPSAKLAQGIALNAVAPLSGVPKPTATAVAEAIARNITNRLAATSSPYLKIAAAEPVLWQPFDAQAFQLAQALDRPILLAVGGAWCHWCLTMDQESYSDPGAAAQINRDFVAIRVDADERPDLDRRFQRAAQTVGHEAGWPLTLFLTPEGEVFAGGAYFPLEERSGRPGLKDMLTLLASAYRDRREAVAGKTAELDGELAQIRGETIAPGSADSTLAADLGRSLLDAYDPKYGGFGNGAKFPAPQAVDLALRLYQDQHNPLQLAAAVGTLDGMAAGGIRDQLGGAFHRFTLDSRWQEPHFEIVGALNGALAVSYLHAYQVTGGERFRIVAERVVDYLDRTLVDQQHGGFYNGQNADVGTGDDGDYYTWTVPEIMSVLPPKEAAAALRYFGLPEPDLGIKLKVPLPASRNVLYTARSISAIAGELGMPYDQARATLESARDHLKAARANRLPAPVDTSFLSDRNGALASAYLEAAAILGRSDLRDIALRAIDRLIALPRRDGLLAHTYVDNQPVASGMLDDQMMVINALLDAYSVTSDRRYLNASGSLLERSIAVFGDQRDGGFFDVSTEPGPGTASFREHAFEDGMILDGNPLAAIVLDRYAGLTRDRAYRDLAEGTLVTFAGRARSSGSFASGYGLALHYHLQGK